MKRKREEGLPYISKDVVEASKNAKGGSELIYERVKDRVPEDLWNYFQVILSRVRELEDKPRIVKNESRIKILELEYSSAILMMSFSNFCDK